MLRGLGVGESVINRDGCENGCTRYAIGLRLACIVLRSGLWQGCRCLKMVREGSMNECRETSAGSIRSLCLSRPRRGPGEQREMQRTLEILGSGHLRDEMLRLEVEEVCQSPASPV